MKIRSSDSKGDGVFQTATVPRNIYEKEQAKVRELEKKLEEYEAYLPKVPLPPYERRLAKLLADTDARLGMALTALRNILAQPFEGSWDAQARYVAKILMKCEREEDEAKGG